MIINLSNHPSATWTDEQKAAAQRYGELRDLQFPNVSPSWSTEDVKNSAKYFCRQCLDIFSGEPGPHVVHIAGEILFCHFAITLLLEAGITVVSSTTERNVTYNQKGDKVSTFRFVQFRELLPDATR